MKRTIFLLRPYAYAGSALLLSILFLAGCSEADDDGRNHATGQYGLEPSEFIALKKAGMSRADLKKEQIKKKVEDMKERGIVVETTTSSKKSRQPR